MWETEQAIVLPRTKQPFFIASHWNEIVFIKAGKGYSFYNGDWSPIRNFGLMTRKICQVVPSQSKKISLHLPKLTPILAIHENRKTSVVLTLPIPFNFMAEETPYVNICEGVTVKGESICLATTHQRVGDMPFIFSQQPKFGSPFATHVRCMAVNDDARIIAVDFDDQLWVWNQLPEEVRGDGHWINLSTEDSFDYKKFERINNTYPLAFQKLAVFNNPDEGTGVCFLSCLLPPCKPFDMIYLYNSVCVFADKRKCYRYHIKIPVLEGHEKPQAFWSPDCRVLVISVNNSLILLTRELKNIAAIPLKKVFLGENAMVQDLTWSAHTQYFITTSTTGFVGCVTRDGKSLKHKICDLQLFQEDYYQPLNVTADTKDPNLFIVYSQKHMRMLRLDKEVIEPFIGNFISLPFPTKNASSLITDALNSIDKVNPSSPQEVVRLLYYSDLYGVFFYHNPLCYYIFKKINESLTILLNEGHHLLCYFLVRCAHRVTDRVPDAYHEIIKRLGFSDNKRDKLMLRILDEELQKRDWGFSSLSKRNIIKMYIMTNEDEMTMKDRVRPDANRNADLPSIIKYVRDILYDQDFYEIDEIPVDITMLFEMMIDLGRFDRAAILSKHESIHTDTIQLLVRISSIHSKDPIAIFQAMEVCINASPVDEPEFRAICIMAINNILKQKIADSSPSMENSKPQYISSRCVIEESVDIPVPEKREECDDFAVICGIALCAADYVNLQYFCNGKSVNIPNNLRPAIRELIQLLWFVRWRHQAMKETYIEHKPGNAMLRLIPFSDFIDQSSIKAMVREVGKNNFDPMIYDLYMEGTGEFELDPDFIDFICEISVRVSPRIISRIEMALSSFSDPFDDIQESSLLTSVICSHVVPWLRCGIPRAMVNFQNAPEVVPNELLDFEDFILLAEKPKPLQLEVKPSFDVPAICEIPKIIEEEEDKNEPENKPQEDPFEMPDSVPTPNFDEERQLSEGEEPPKPKRPKKDSKKKKPTKQTHKNERKRKDQKPRLRLIEVDKTQPKNLPVSIQPPSHIPEFAPGYQFNPIQPNIPPVAIFQSVHAPYPQQSYGPIWDLDPSLYERPYPKPPPKIPMEDYAEESSEKPIKLTASAQCEPRFYKRPKVILTSSAKPLPDLSDVSETNDSEISLDSDREILPPVDPFPLDDELRKRVDSLLNNPVNIKTPQLPSQPRYTTKITRREHALDQEYKESK